MSAPVPGGCGGPGRVRARFKSLRHEATDVTTTGGPPAPSGGHPLLGQTLPFLSDPLGSLRRWGRADEDVLQARVGGRTFCLVSAPGPTERVLTTDADAYRKADIVRENLETLQGGSLVLLEGEEWRERRRLLRSGFGDKQARAAGSVTARYAADAVDSWPDEVRVDERMRSLSLSVLARVLFGLDLRGGRTPIDEAADDVLARMDPRSLSAFLPEWVPTPTNYRFRAAVRTLHDRIDGLVAGADPARDDLLGTMLSAGVAPERIRDELIALLFAGYDSTATALAVTLALVGDHPDVQARLREELAEAPDEGGPESIGAGDRPYLDAVVRESLRLYPPQYLLFREPSEAVTLGGYRVEAGTTVVLSPWLCGRDGAHWDAPAQFRPERWLSERDRPRFAYFPYGGGPRYCLGRRLAERTIRTVVSVVCRRRALRLPGDLSVSAGPTLSLDPLELQARPDPV